MKRSLLAAQHRHLLPLDYSHHWLPLGKDCCQWQDFGSTHSSGLIDVYCIMAILKRIGTSRTYQLSLRLKDQIMHFSFQGAFRCVHTMEKNATHFEEPRNHEETSRWTYTFVHWESPRQNTVRASNLCYLGGLQ